MKEITNSLTKILDELLLTEDQLDHFIDDLEDEVLGLSARDFYVKYKGDIKELLDSRQSDQIDYSIESELLAALMVYCSQRKCIEDK